ncbi:probable transcription regulator protein [Oceanicola granulosus HTCC2516]|uniref:Probable transcription regulator protein n=1 Tax=Oceanicola granulosus (strain ATCC BAA-861 / DSM 15982 / KCTC 12143 / HTCC2516) TaxID=314256 RepID=Q2CH16_OCEGH|nr:LysR substrate-binding domain-containing protein [Oceanicola granulosus]EAR51995.1 probable transcription regulator protein [Oceanicola granulosus HTCC2516]
MTRRLPPLTALRTFEAAARHESFKRAAEELHVTNAAVSHQIKTLEDKLGLSLFRRRGRAVQPTDAAKRFAGRLAQAFDTIEAATMELQGNPMSGTLRIAVTPFYGNRIVLPRLSRFHALYPEIRVEPEMSETRINFAKTDLDGALRYGTGNWPGLTAIAMHEDQLLPVAAPTVVSRRDLPLSAAEIAQLTLGYIDGQEDDWSAWFEMMGYEGVASTQMIGYGSRARVVDLAFSGHGVALADRRLTAADVTAGHLVRLNDTPVSTGRGIWLVYPDTEFPDPRLMAFGDWFRTEIGQI